MFDLNDFRVRQSRAVEPLFFRAPYPHQKNGDAPGPFQHAGAEFALARDHCLIGDEPGVGKTLQAILISNALKAKKTLVVCPASLRLNWEREIWKWASIPNVSTYPILKAADGVSTQADYVIVSYDLLRNTNIMAGILAQRWDHVVLDEAHAIKDPKGNKRMRAICAPDMLPSVAGRFTLLSGTILPNQPIECFGPDTLVLTDRGWVAITDVTINDLLWDGVEWVAHTGLIYRGEKKTLNVAGVSVTPEHNVNVNGSWLAAESLTSQGGALLRQALETGSASLPSVALKSASAAGSWASLFNAIAAPQSSPRRPNTSGPEGRHGAGRAAPRQASRQTGYTANTQQHAQTSNCESGFSGSGRTSYSDATTQKSPAGKTMAAEAYSCTSHGVWVSSADKRSLRILSRSQATMPPASNLTASTTIEDTNPATSGSQPASRTWPTAERSVLANSSIASQSLKPVYDLTNAGPRRRFTVLTNQGPLLVHNCYNAVRLLDWGAIDEMSLEDFREHFYAEGGGMVRSPVWDEDKKANVSKLHWSDRVRNVPRNLDELQFRLRSRIMIRRLKSQVHTQLPAKTFHLVPLAITPEMRAALKHPGWGMAEKLHDLDPGSFDANLPVDGEVSTARRLLGEAKADPGCDYIDELLASGVTKIVVSAWHTSVLKIARDRLAKHGLVYMDGSTGSAARQKAVDTFQTNLKVKVILGQTQVMGEGHTLTAAQDVVLLEPDWVPGRITQMVDRIHRLGQQGERIVAHLPVAPGTLDERVIAAAVEKDKNIHLALDAV